MLQVTPVGLVRSVIDDRRRALARAAGPLPASPAGRLLVYFPEDDTTDGSAQAATGGFFDPSSTPPWDTWVGWFVDEAEGLGDGFRGCLLAWMPQSAVTLAELARSVICEQSLVWLEDSDTAPRQLWCPAS